MSKDVFAVSGLSIRPYLSQGSTLATISYQYRLCREPNGSTYECFHLRLKVRCQFHKTLDRHVKNRIIELGRSVESRIPIYLDVVFWILLRDAMLGSPRKDGEKKLLRQLRHGVASGAVLCPASDAVFLELLKQSDPFSRVATAHLIDELSLGVTLLHNEARMETEVAHFIHSFEDDASLHPLQHLVWSKLSSVLGFVHPITPHFDDETQLVQKAFFDYFWNIPLATLVGMIDDAPNAKELRLDDIGEMLTEGNARHAGQRRNFEQTQRAELFGVADLCSQQVSRYFQIGDDPPLFVWLQRAGYVQDMNIVRVKARAGALSAGCSRTFAVLAYVTPDGKYSRVIPVPIEIPTGGTRNMPRWKARSRA